AVIDAEGEVMFSDLTGVRFGEVGGLPTDGGNTAIGVSLNFTFDISDEIERAFGNDPYAAERRWFLEGTRELRHRLMEATRRREEGRALVRLRRWLRETWEAEGPVAARAAFFERWDGMSEDEIGTQAREAVLEYIRRVAPQGSDVAYGAAELRRLNGVRESRGAFAPYSVDDVR
ncbi:MAG: hypothetical protein AAF645_10550, partial [Myxococcota bacterium]